MNDERENLVSFSKIKEIINGINPQEDMVEFSASVGTQINLLDPPYQTVDLRIVFRREKDNETNNQ